MTAYLVDLLQHHRTNSSTLVFDVHLAELVPVGGDEANFPNRILVAHPVKEIVDPARRSLLKRMVEVDVHHLAVPRKIRRSVGEPMERKGREGHSTYSLHRPSILFMCDSVKFS